MLYYEDFPFVPKVIQTELISHHYNNFLAGHFGI